MNRSLSPRVYRILLLAYPAQFRREYGLQMAQVFRDVWRYQRRQETRFGLLRLWLETLLDLIRTVPHEHLHKLGKEKSLMNTLRKDALAVVGCLAIIVIAFFLLQYGRSNNVSSILLFGYILDAVVTTGLIGNLVIFILVKTTRFNSLRTAFWTFLIVTAVPAILVAIIGSRVDPQFRLGSVLVGYVVSFLFWYGLHWMWSLKGRGQVAA